MTHSDYIKQRDHILESVQNYIDNDDAKREGRILAAKAIDALVLQVIGDDVLPANEYSVNWTDNNLKAEQRKTVQGDK